MADGLLLEPDAATRYRERWNEVQLRFLDTPRESVQDADQLVGELLEDLTGRFAAQRSALEERWSGGDEVTTEDLRVALRRYRDFFSRLLAA